MLHPNKTYALDSDCSALCLNKAMAVEHYGGPVVLKSSPTPAIYEDFPNRSDHPVYDDLIYKKFKRLYSQHIDEINAEIEAAHNEKIENATGEEKLRLQDTFPPYVSDNISSPYDTNAFQLIPSSDGIQLHIMHYAPAPRYPAGASPHFCLLSEDLFAERGEVVQEHGACSGLKTKRLNTKWFLFDELMEKFADSDAITKSGENVFITFFEIKPYWPVSNTVNRKSPVTFNRVSNVENYSGVPCEVVTTRSPKSYKKSSTALKKMHDTLKFPWSRLVQGSDGRWCAETTFWKPIHGTMTIEQRVTLANRVKETLKPSVQQDNLAFGLFTIDNNASHPPALEMEEGSGITMGH